MNALIFLFYNLSRLYLLCYLLRLMLQVARADFYNPAAEFIVAITNPLVVPARRLLPSFRKFDLPTLIVLVVLQFVVTTILMLMRREDLVPAMIVIDAIYQLLTMPVWLYLIFIIVWVIMSWFQSAYHPVSTFLGQIIEPVLRPARRLLPQTSGFDASTVIVPFLLIAILIALGDLRVTLLARVNGLY